LKIIYSILLILFFSCTDLLINVPQYHSVELKGNAWVQINQGSSFNKNNFTLQTWFSGSDSSIDNTQTLFSMVNSNGEILLGVFKDPISTNQVNIWINNENITTVDSKAFLNDINSFNLLTIKGDTTQNHTDNPSLISIEIFMNKIKLIDQDTNLTLDKIDNIDFIIGAKTNNQHTFRNSFWHGCIDEIRLWNTALSDSIIEYHNDYPYKLSFESDSLTYVNSIGHLDGLWRFYTEEEAYFNIPNDACSTIERLYNDNPCSTDSEALIYTLENNKIEFSEKHK